jgi:hypothetical protein
MRLILSIMTGLFFSQAGLAEIWEKPPYRPDENHLPRIIYLKQAQEESPRPTQPENKNQQKNVKKEKKSGQ